MRRIKRSRNGHSEMLRIIYITKCCNIFYARIFIGKRTQPRRSPTLKAERNGQVTDRLQGAHVKLQDEDATTAPMHAAISQKSHAARYAFTHLH